MNHFPSTRMVQVYHAQAFCCWVKKGIELQFIVLVYHEEEIRSFSCHVCFIYDADCFAVIT